MTASISFLVRTSRPVRDEMVTNDYVLNMDRIRGRFSITIITAEDLMIVKVEGWPDIKSRLSTVESESQIESREQMNLSEVVEEVTVHAVRGGADGYQVGETGEREDGVNNTVLSRPSLISNFPTLVRKYSEETRQDHRKVRII
jgi:hypothetical protein